MRRPLALLLLSGSLAALAQTGTPAQPKTAVDPLAQRFVSDFDLPSAAQDAEARLQHAPYDTTALFVHMETAELEDRPEIVLDSALRLCTLPADSTLQEVASNR